MTHDDRVPELIEAVHRFLHNPLVPILCTPLGASSHEYAEWVKNQTESMDLGLKFYEVDPFHKSKPIAHEAVSSMDDHLKELEL